jgi:hypothetical protein
MGNAAVEFECECKATTQVEFTEPERMFDTKLVPFECSGCLSDWVMRFRKTPKGLAATHKLVGPTRKLQDALQRRKAEELRNLPEKKAPQFFTGRRGNPS